MMKNKVAQITLNLLCALAVCVSLLAAPTISAQQVPVPTDFATSHNVFVAYGSGTVLRDKEKFLSQFVYSTFRDAMAKWAFYNMVLSPRSADLAFDIALQFTSSDVTNGSSTGFPSILLNVRDAKSNVLLWSFNEPLRPAIREEAIRKNAGDTIDLLVSDLKAMAAGRLPDSSPASTSAKTRFGQDKP